MIQHKTDAITVFQSELYETTSTVIESKDAIVLVDPNWLPSEVEGIKSFIKEKVKNKQLYLVLTHSDFDHIIGANAFPEAIVIASESFVNNPNKQAILDEINDFDQMFYLKRTYDTVYPKVSIVIKENETHLQLGDLNCLFYLSPGHTEDGLFFYIKEYKTLVAGDYLSDVEFPFITSSYTDYLQTIHLMQKVTQIYEVALLIPGHGQATDQIQKRIDFALWYLDKINNSVNIEAQLMKGFSFYQGMKKAHQNNLKFIKGRDKDD